MKKIINLFLSFILFLMLLPTAKADVTYEIPNNYQVVYIKNNVSETSCDNSSVLNYNLDNVEILKNFDVYNDALTYLNSEKDVEGKTLAIIGKKKNKEDVYVNKVLYVKYGLVDINTTGTTMTNTYVYTSSSSSTVYTYINGSGAFGGVDTAFIDYSNETTRARIKISGAEGWINSILSLNSTNYNGYEVIPANLVKSPSYYYVNSSGNLVHRLAKKITASNCYTSVALNLGPAPSFLTATDSNDNTIKYYSYDSNYFYTNIEDMITDYRTGDYSHAVNSIPYYNYYMYAPIRTKSNITSDDIKGYFNSRSVSTSSALYGTELIFKDAETKYGVNAAMSIATAINESGWGTSYLATQKNNLFGHNAYDSSVMSSASKYNTVADGIYRHAYYYINAGFAETKDAIARYFGSHLGNKGSGINVKYASDAYWGEKLAAQYYALDSYAEMKDYYSYTIGIKVNSTPAPVMKEPSTSSITLYKLESYYVDPKNMPVVILDIVNGESIDGNSVWYKIQTDAVLTSDRTGIIQDTTINDYYDWDNNYAYVHSSYITLMDSSVSKVYLDVDGVFGLYDLSNNSDGTINITGYLAMSTINNTKDRTISYSLILTDESGNSYTKSLNRILDESKMPYQVAGRNNNDYTYSWFTGNIDLSDIPQGNYSLYVEAISSNYRAKEVVSNKLSINISTKFNSGTRGYQFKTNYYLKTIPVELYIRDDGLISDGEVSTFNNMLNQYTSIKLEDNKLKITGSSYNIGGDYSTSSNIDRKIVFENNATFERFTYDLGYIDNSSYNITLAVPDNKDKTRAWFNNEVDLSEIPVGTYSIYIKTESNIKDYGELTDIFLRELNESMIIGDKTYTLKINNDHRFRIELIVT